MKKQFVSVAALALLFATASASRAEDKFQETPYYPVKVGSTWTYRVTGQNQAVQSIQIKVSAHQKVDGVTCAVLEASANGSVVAKEFVSPQAEGVLRYKGQDQDIAPPLEFLKLPPMKAFTWKVDSKVGPLSVKGTCSLDTGSVTVPFGNYNDAVISKNDLELGNQKVSTTYYFAKDVGMVKQIANINGTNLVLELEKYEPGK